MSYKAYLVPNPYGSPLFPRFCFSFLLEYNGPVEVFSRLKKLKKKDLKGVDRIAAFALLSSLTAALCDLLLKRFGIVINPFLLAFVSVLVSAWAGKVWGITFATFFNLLIIILISTASNNFWLNFQTYAIEIGLFILGAFMVGATIYKIKNDEEIKEYRRKEKEHLQLLNLERIKNAKAIEEIKARDEFLSLASHELKTPLTSMLLQVQSVLHSVKSVSLADFSVSRLLEMLEGAEIQTKRLSKMINDLLNVSLITTGKLDLEIGEFDINQAVKEVVDSFKERAKRENYSLSLKTSGPVVGKWDKIRIEQAITNLVSNAFKYGNGKPIEVSVERAGSNAKIVVKDKGIGIPGVHREKIFEKFERGVTGESHNYRGLGVGLYITTQIVDAHKGKIKLESEEGKGSTFTLELPIRR